MRPVRPTRARPGGPNTADVPRHKWRRLDVGNPVQLVLIPRDLARETSSDTVLANRAGVDGRARHHLGRDHYFTPGFMS